MKKYLLFAMILFASYSLFSQSVTRIAYYNWSDPMTFKLSPRPTITGYGYYSDSLSKMFDGKTFYVYNDEYFPIESWADYYFWFTKVYWFKFEDPQLYAFYYWAGDDHGMASYIASYKYRAKYYPSSIFVDFGDNQLKGNRLATDECFSTTDEKVEALKKELEYVNEEIEIKKDDFIKKEAPEIFKKEDFRKTEYKKESPNTKMELKDESFPKRKEDQSSPKRKNEIK